MPSHSKFHIAYQMTALQKYSKTCLKKLPKDLDTRCLWYIIRSVNPIWTPIIVAEDRKLQ
jgi:hypothetical protein